MKIRGKFHLKRSTVEVAKRAMLLGVFTAFFLSVAFLILTLAGKVAVGVFGVEPNMGFRSPLVVGVAAWIAWALPGVLAGYVVARVGRRAPLASMAFSALFFLTIGGAVDLLEGDLASVRGLLKSAESTALVILGGMLALPVNACSNKKIESVLTPALMLAFELLIAGIIYAIGMWAALETGPLAGLASIAVMAITMAGTIAMTEPERRDRLALVLVAAGWTIPVSVVALGVAIGLDTSSAAWLVFFQTLAVICGYAWLFRLYPEQFRGEQAPIWARRFIRRRPIKVPSEESLA